MATEPPPDFNPLDLVKPRTIDPNPRCTCSSEDPRGRLPMFHPLHRWGPCQVRVGGEPCGCTRNMAEAPSS